MNVGALFVLIELLKDIEIAGGLIGPPAPNGTVQTGEIKPNCGPGSYASKDTFGNWTCVPIPKGR
jgi:hypothetical protein